MSDKVYNQSGGANLNAQGDITIGGDVVGRDKIGATPQEVVALIITISKNYQPRPFDGRCPYLGLDAFSEDEADRFFGREKLVDELLARIKASRFVVIAGPSGGGKSSLVRAGLIHALKQGTLPDSERWLYTTLTPGRDPIKSLAWGTSRLAQSPDAGDYVWEHKTEEDALHKLAEAHLSDRPDQRAIVFVDQFEEVFTQVSKEDERAAFLNLLTHAATLENGRVTVLLALRSDFVSNCATYPQLNALLNQQFLQVGALSPEELVNAIARPALQVGLRIDPDLIAQIINEMKGEPGTLPLMQFALKDLFDAQQHKGGVVALTLNDYLQRGGIHKSLERHADTAFARLTESEQQLAQVIFRGLIAIGQGAQDTRRTALFNELVPAEAKADAVQAVVQKLADARLITTDERDDTRTVTLAHEALIDAWPWLRRLIDENREVIALQNQIAEDAQEWEKSHCDPSYLYAGVHLANAREQLAAQKIVLSGLAQAFIEASIDVEEAKHQQEETRRQKELDDARRVAELVAARARAEVMRTRLLLGIIVLGIVAVITLRLAIPTVQGMLLRQQAMTPMIAFPAAEVVLDSGGQVYQVGAFTIDASKVTNRRYLLCMQAGACLRPISGSDDFLPAARADLPVVNVTALEAYQFCNWLSARLPDEQEWQRAAQSGATPDGIFDLAGTAWEWTRSDYDLPGKDWTDIDADPPETVTVRGGADSTLGHVSNMADRNQADPWKQQDNIGFRCAVTQ